MSEASQDCEPTLAKDEVTVDSLHKRRFDAKPGDLPESLTVTACAPGTSGPSTLESASPRLTPEDEQVDSTALCDVVLRRLDGRTDALSARTRDAVFDARAAVEALNDLEKLQTLMAQLLELKEQRSYLERRARDAALLADMAALRKRVALEMERAYREQRELELHNDALDADLEPEFSYTEALLDSMLSARRDLTMKRSTSRWKAQKLRGSLLRKQRSRSVGGEESEGGSGAGEARLSVPAASRDRRSPEDCRKSKVSKWTKVKAAFKWEKAHQGVAGGAASVVGAAGALAGAVALAGSSPSTPVTPAPAAQAQQEDSACATPGTPLSLTPDSSCEELRMDLGRSRKSGAFRCDENDNTFLHAPALDESSNSPSPSKLHKTPWGKMRDIIQTRKESVRRKQRSGRAAASPRPRRRSCSDGGDSDAPPALTLTLPSSEELDPEAEPAAEPPAEHLVVRKQSSLELTAAPALPGGAAGRPPAGRRTSKWSKVKKAFLTSASASVPSSPNRHSAFFTDVETEAASSGCEAAGVREAIRRDYAALQCRLGREFSDKRDKLYAARPVATEDQLSADFRKKLAEWQRMKGGASGASARQPPPVPDRSDLSEDFLSKWDAWNRLKERNCVPAWEQEARPDEVLVHTSTGFFRFQGISRSFTRKLHEWEKARGIAPEASTSALLRAAQGAQGSRRRAARGSLPPAPLARAQSAGSVALSSSSPSVHVHGSSLSVNDADKLHIDYENDNQSEGAVGDEMGDEGSSNETESRGAVLVEVEAEEVCTAAPLVAVSPRHMPQKPVYTYDHEEPARLLCETSSAAAFIQQEAVTARDHMGNAHVKLKSKSSLQSQKSIDKVKDRRPVMRQPSIEDDAQFIRRTIEEIERGSSNRVNSQYDSPHSWRKFNLESPQRESKDDVSSSTPTSHRAHIDYSIWKSDIEEYPRKCVGSKVNLDDTKINECNSDEMNKKKDLGINGKKKLKARARLEREASKPSETDSEPDVDNVTVEFPRRRKRPRRPSEKPKTPPPSASAASDAEEQVYILKLKTPEKMEASPEVIVKTKRKIFSPVVRTGEATPRAVIPLDVEELAEVSPNVLSIDDLQRMGSEESTTRNNISRDSVRKNRDDLSDTRSRLQVNLEGSESAEDQRTRSRPPLPSSPSAQRRPPPKETAPSIRIMIQRYNLKINEDGHTSPASSGTSSPAWISPASQRRRPPDMPARVNIKNNPFFEREVQKSASACQLSRREMNSSERRLEVPPENQDGVLKSHSACSLHPEAKRQLSVSPTPLPEESETPNINPSITSNSQTSLDTPVCSSNSKPPIFEAASTNRMPHSSIIRPSIDRLISSTSTGSVGRVSLERIMSGLSQERRVSIEMVLSKASVETAPESVPKEVGTPSERTQKIRAARERFLSSPAAMRRDVSGSAGELRPGDRLSRASCGSDVSCEDGAPAGAELGRSASTGMVNVDRGAWQRVQQEGAKGRRSSRRQGGSGGGRFSLSRLAARLRRRQEESDGGAISRLCRQSLLVQLPPEQS